MRKLAILVVLLFAGLLTSCDQETLEDLSPEFGIDPELEDELTNHSGGLLSSNTVYDKRNFTGTVTIPCGAENITIQNSVLTNNIGTSPQPIVKSQSTSCSTWPKNVIIKDSDLRGQFGDTCSEGALVWNVDYENIEVTGCRDGLKLKGVIGTDGNDDVQTLHHSFIWNLDKSGPDEHADALQITSGSNFHIYENFLFAPYRDTNAVLQIGESAGQISDILFEDNLVSGGGYAINNNHNRGQPTNVVIRNNILEEGSTLFPQNPGQTWPEHNGFIVGMSPTHCGNEAYEDVNDQTPLALDAPC